MSSGSRHAFSLARALARAASGRWLPLALWVAALLLAPRPARATDGEPSPRGPARPELPRPGDTWLTGFNQERIQANRAANFALTGWSGANLAVSGIGAFVTDERGPARYFHQANAGISLFVLGTAGVGYYALAQQDPLRMDFGESLRRGLLLERLLLVGVALDVGALGLGAWLWERGLRERSDPLIGYGRAFAFQGAVLLAFDSTIYWLNYWFDSRLTARLTPTCDGAAASVTLRF